MKKTSKIRSMNGALKMLRIFFNDETITKKEQTKLWDVLTALRGPDTEDFYTKLATTCIIRDKVGFDGGCMVDTDHKHYVPIRKDLPNSHFKPHAMNAFGALGLEWDKLN